MTKDLDFKVISTFFPVDRLEEVVHAHGKIPRLPDGDLDMYEAANLLCAKDGGHLITPEESAKLVEWLYSDYEGNHPKVDTESYTDLDGYTIDLEKAKAIGLKRWDRDEITKSNVDVDLWLGKESSSSTNDAYSRGFGASSTNVYDGDDSRTGTGLQAVCVGDEV